MEVKDGGAAMEAWSEMIAATDAPTKQKLRKALLDYCKLDTLAMVRIYQFIDQLKN